MKKLSPVFILLTLVFASCHNGKTDGDDVATITIKHTELGRQTLFRIKCETFDKYFPDAKVKTLNKKTDIENVANILKGMKNTSNDNEPDVRSLLYIRHLSKTIDTVCVGTTFSKYKGATYETPQELLKVIQE